MPGPPAAVAALRVAVRGALADLPTGSLVLVACSGGADSLALAAATAFVAPRAGLVAGAVVVDHGLLPGSDAVALRAATQCEGLGLAPVSVRRVVVTARGAGPEAQARTARLAALEEEARATGAAAVLLGHTRDDQAETVLLGLARGAGARSLSGMRPRRGLLRRPLLGLPREVVRAACAAAGLDPWEDPTNADRSLARSRVRADVLPYLEHQLGPGVVAALARTADGLRDDADLLDGLAADLSRTARLSSSQGSPGGVTLEVGVLAGAPAALRRRALRAAALEAGARDTDLTRGHVLEVERLVTAWHGQGPLQLPGVVAERRRHHLHLLPTSRSAAPATPGGPAQA